MVRDPGSNLSLTDRLQFTDAIKDLAQDLQDKRDFYEAALEGNAIYDALNDLEPVLFVSRPGHNPTSPLLFFQDVSEMFLLIS